MYIKYKHIRNERSERTERSERGECNERCECSERSERCCLQVTYNAIWSAETSKGKNK